MRDKAESKAREPSTENRSADRKNIRLEVRSTSSKGTSFFATVYDLSSAGLLLGSDVPLSVGDEIFVDLPRTGLTAAAVVWAGDGLFGCQFSKAISRAVLGAAQLQSPAQALESIRHATADPAEPLHSRLRRLRKEMGLGVAELAETVTVSKLSIWNWETGRARPKQENLSALAQALKTTVPELLFGSPSAPGIDDDSYEEGSAADSEPEQVYGKNRPMGRELGTEARLSQLIAAHKEQIAALTGTDVTKVKILVEF